MSKRYRGAVQSGFSLVELMVALTLGLVLVAGVVSLSSRTKQANTAMNQASQQLENGRFAMEKIKDDIHHAGFVGELCLTHPNDPPDPTRLESRTNLCLPAPPLPTLPAATLSAALPDPCNDTVPATLVATLGSGFLLPVLGYDNPTASPVSCIPPADFTANTDILVVRRAETQAFILDAPLDDDDGDGDAANADLKPGRVYLQTRNNQYVLAVCDDAAGANCWGQSVTGAGFATVAPSAPVAKMAMFSLLTKTPTGGGPAPTAAPIRLYDVHIYYIRPWSVNPGDGIPTLVREVLTTAGGAPAMRAEPLIDGIENLQVQYGIDDGTPSGVANDGTPDRYVTLPKDVGEWSRVIAVRVNLLARNLEPVYGYKDDKSYDLGEELPDTIKKPGGNYKRHAFANVVRFINIGTGRER